MQLEPFYAMAVLLAVASTTPSLLLTTPTTSELFAQPIDHDFIFRTNLKQGYETKITG
jgi:hypothetical protein